MKDLHMAPAAFAHVPLALTLCVMSGCGQAPPEPAGESRQFLGSEFHPTELLRRLSFDLRGGPPTDEEIATVQAAGDVPEELIAAMVGSDDFLDQVQDWHAEILWPNISRYRLNAEPLGTVEPERYENWEDIGVAANSYVNPDPTLVEDEEYRERYVLAFEDENVGGQLRGGRHAQPAHFCDTRPEAEYPDPSVVGTAANRYTIPAERSGNGVA